MSRARCSHPGPCAGNGVCDPTAVHCTACGATLPESTCGPSWADDAGLCPLHGVRPILVTCLVGPAWECPRCLESGCPECGAERAENCTCIFVAGKDA